MTVVVFVGPTLDLETARTILPDAEFLPPAGQSDLISAARQQDVHAIALIDGYFRQQLAVWHKEILLALDEGVHVYGSSSMGALRAAELAPYGMVGVGQVYDWYVSGVVDRDDEVAIIHGDEDSGYKNLSVALVNMRATLGDAVVAGVIDGDAHERLLRVAGDIDYPRRTYDRLAEHAITAGLDEEIVKRFAAFASTNGRDVKREDAVALLDRLAAEADGLDPVQLDYEVEQPHVVQAMVERDIQYRHSGADVSHAEIAYHAALHEPGFNEFNFAALNRAIVARLAGQLDIEVDEPMIDAEERRLRVRLGLGDDERFAEWCRRNDLGEAAFRGLMREHALCRRMQRWLLMSLNYRGTSKAIVDALRLADRYEDVAAETGLNKHMIGGDVFDTVVDPTDESAMSGAIVDHLRATDCRMDVHYKLWLHESGFPDVRALAIELERSRRARERGAAAVDQLRAVLSESPDDDRA